MMAAGWRAILAAIAGFGVIMTIWCGLRLPETLHEEDRRELRAGPIIAAFRIVLAERTAFGYAVGAGLIFGCLFAFLNSAQQIYQEEYGLGALFPIVFSSGAIFIAVASFLNSRLVERLGMRLLSHFALVGFALVSAFLCLVALADGGHVPFWIFFASIVVAFALFAFVGTNFNALAMDPLGHVAGTASSVVSSLQTFVGGALGASVGLAYDGTVLPLSLGFLLMSLASFAVVAVTERRRLFGRAEVPAE
jgi:DHA1 family bicyclomycin/chloramphenicol resistance-like MFS transporter